MLNIDLIKKKVRTTVAPENIFYYEITDSTNTRALEYARCGENIADRAVFIASGQTAGRGRRGRSFVSNTDAGIYISLLYTPHSETDIERITARSAVALKNAIHGITKVSTGIKWVNDLYAVTPMGENKKLAGILAEAVTSDTGKIDKICVGMGINVYKYAISEEISDIATSLEEVSGRIYSKEEIISSVILNFYKKMSDSQILAEYRACSLTLGKEVRVIPHSGEEYDALVTDILDDYSLTVRTASGEDRRVFSGEVRARIK